MCSHVFQHLFPSDIRQSEPKVPPLAASWMWPCWMNGILDRPAKKRLHLECLPVTLVTVHATRSLHLALRQEALSAFP